VNFAEMLMLCCALEVETANSVNKSIIKKFFLIAIEVPLLVKNKALQDFLWVNSK
jgi:hypothetical protein